MGEAQHRRFRRRPDQRDAVRAVGRRAERAGASNSDETSVALAFGIQISCIYSLR